MEKLSIKKLLSLFDKKFLKDVFEIDLKNEEVVISAMKLCTKLNILSLNDLISEDEFIKCKVLGKKELVGKELILKNAWIALALNLARNVKCKEFNEKALKSALNLLKEESRSREFHIIDRLKKILSECGVKLIVLPYLAKSHIRGFTKYDKEKNYYIVAINDCGKALDKFFFTLFHEISHILYGKEVEMNVTSNKKRFINEEKIIDYKAQNLLIKDEEFNKFILKNNLSINAIYFFANKVRVDASLVIGRLQNEGYISYSTYTKYKRRIDCL